MALGKDLAGGGGAVGTLGGDVSGSATNTLVGGLLGIALAVGGPAPTNWQGYGFDSTTGEYTLLQRSRDHYYDLSDFGLTENSTAAASANVVAAQALWDDLPYGAEVHCGSRLYYLDAPVYADTDATSPHYNATMNITLSGNQKNASLFRWYGNDSVNGCLFWFNGGRSVVKDIEFAGTNLVNKNCRALIIVGATATVTTGTSEMLFQDCFFYAIGCLAAGSQVQYGIDFGGPITATGSLENMTLIRCRFFDLYRGGTIHSSGQPYNLKYTDCAFQNGSSSDPTASGIILYSPSTSLVVRGTDFQHLCYGIKAASTNNQISIEHCQSESCKRLFSNITGTTAGGSVSFIGGRYAPNSYDAVGNDPDDPISSANRQYVFVQHKTALSLVGVNFSTGNEKSDWRVWCQLGSISAIGCTFPNLTPFETNLNHSAGAWQLNTLGCIGLSGGVALAVTQGAVTGGNSTGTKAFAAADTTKTVTLSYYEADTNYKVFFSIYSKTGALSAGAYQIEAQNKTRISFDIVITAASGSDFVIAWRIEP